MVRWFKKLWQRLSGTKPPFVTVLRLNGAIGMRSGLNRGLSLADTAELIEKLFADTSAEAVAIIINSPGGSPVQAALIHDRIRDLATEKDMKVLAFAEDIAASGGYMLALAGDEIYAHENSIVGSIGVISAGFGFQGLIEKLGVERRVHTAGTRKAMLDPFVPEDPDDAKHLEDLQREVHESFKAMVRKRRGDSLKESGTDLFSGLFWTGAKAKSFGLIDGLGDLRSVCRRKFGENVELHVIQPRRSWWSSGRSAVRQLPEPLFSAEAVIESLEDRALWARFGL